MEPELVAGSTKLPLDKVSQFVESPNEGPTSSEWENCHTVRSFTVPSGVRVGREICGI